MTLKHSAVGASRLWQAANCPGAVTWADRVNEEFGRIDDRKDASLGTATHGKIESFLRPWADGDAELEELETDGDDELDRVLSFLEWLLEGQQVAEINLEVTLGFGVNVPEPLRGVISTPDLVLIFEDESAAPIVVDWKTGWHGPHDDQITLQLAAYMALVKATRGCESIEGYMLGTKKGDQRCLATTDFDYDQAISIWAQVASRAGESEETKAGDWCRYCSALGHCPATRDIVEDTREIFHADELPTKRTEATKEIKRLVDQMLKPRFVELLENLWILESICKAAKARATALESIEPGSTKVYELVTEKGRRTAAGLDLYRLLESEGVPVREIWSEVKIGVPDAEKLWLRAHQKEYEKKIQAKREFEALTAQIVSQPTIQKLKRRRTTS